MDGVWIAPVTAQVMMTLRFMGTFNNSEHVALWFIGLLIPNNIRHLTIRDILFPIGDISSMKQQHLVEQGSSKQGEELRWPWHDAIHLFMAAMFAAKNPFNEARYGHTYRQTGQRPQGK